MRVYIDDQTGNISIEGRVNGDEGDVKTITLEFPEGIGDTTVLLGVFQAAE